MNRKERRAALARSGGKSSLAIDPAVADDYREAVQFLQSGNLVQSEIAHRRVLEKMPQHAPSLHHLGLIAFKQNSRSTAVDLIRKSLGLNPNYHEAWLNLAVILGEMRRSEEAMDACRRSLELQPQNSEPHRVLGNLLRMVEDNAAALAAYTASLNLKPDQPSVLVRLGELKLLAGEIAEAQDYCRRALEIDPSDQAGKSLARRLGVSSDTIEELVARLEAEAASPKELADRLNEVGAILRAERRFDDALLVQHKAIDLDPSNPDRHFDMALVYENLGRNEDAFACYQAGLAIDPNRAEAYVNVGSLMRAMKMDVGAIQAFEHAITLNPELSVAHYNLGVTLKSRDRFDDAKESFTKAVAFAPDSTVSRFELLNVRRVLCDWDGIDDEESLCLDRFRASTATIAPFHLISLSASRADQREAASRYMRLFAVPKDERFATHHSRLGSEGERIRIGFLSSDFFEHATALLLVEVLENIDRRRFETFGYCYSNDDGSNLRHRMVAAFEHFTSIRDATDHDAARMIHADGIDILIDLKGYTKDARSRIPSYRPAPIQVNYLGYPATMGVDFIDYFLADAVTAPMEHQADFAERIVHLPNCYQPNDRKRQISSEPMTRVEAGLPDDAFVFCSFNNSYKLNTDMFDLWMPLLQSMPGSVLWLLANTATARQNLRREAAARGVDPDRLVFAGKVSTATHLARHRLADLFLDALPCNAHTTASDALWAGLPVLTCMGETFTSRVAASLLSAMELPELVTTNTDEYAQMALTLASDRQKLDDIKRRIAEGRMTSPLFDSVRYARNLEKSFETMVEIMRASEAPRPFVVTENSAATAFAEPVVPLIKARVAYDHCPLCESTDMRPHMEAKVTNHPLYNPQLPPTMKWMSCGSCDHVFTEGYFTPEACEIVFSSTHAHQKVGNDAENQRKVSARVVERVARYAKSGDWLDIGVGNGSLLFTAAEWGFHAVGTDLRVENVTKLENLGFEAYAQDIEQLQAVDRFSVVSMADVLEHVPYPPRALAAVHRMMRPGGALFVSMPNMESIIWRVLDATGSNPYWGELEHYHNFSRSRLVALLEANGFKFAEYNISERYRSCMEVIALRV